MIKLNLTPQNKQEELILNYLQNNASETLADKINNGTPFEKDGKISSKYLLPKLHSTLNRCISLRLLFNVLTI